MNDNGENINVNGVDFPLNVQFTKKQKSITADYISTKPKTLVLYGAIRSGKTFLAVFLFMAFIRANKGKNEIYIIGGVSSGTIRRNILDVMEFMLNTQIKLSQYGSFELFGNTIYCFGGADVSKWKTVRGFTAKGALINEATALNYSFVQEVMSRCSLPDSRIFIDTNPDNPMHQVKRELIDNSRLQLSSGRTNILSFHFTLYDNELLDEEYIESLTSTMPSGVFTDRNIWGKWVAAEGAIYSDFNEENLTSEIIVKSTPYVRKFVGVDWGYQHKGVMAVWGVDSKGIRYRIAEHVYSHQDMEFWKRTALNIKQYHGNIPFYCDHSRPENFAALRNAGIDAQLAFNPVMSGIAILATMYKTKKIKIPREPHLSQHFMDEIYGYTYASGGKDAPLEVNDDCMDADRYAVASDYQKQAQVRNRNDNAVSMLQSYGL